MVFLNDTISILICIPQCRETGSSHLNFINTVFFSSLTVLRLRFNAAYCLSHMRFCNLIFLLCMAHSFTAFLHVLIFVWKVDILDIKLFIVGTWSNINSLIDIFLPVLSKLFWWGMFPRSYVLYRMTPHSDIHAVILRWWWSFFKCHSDHIQLLGPASCQLIVHLESSVWLLSTTQF